MDIVVTYDLGPSFGQSVTRICKVPTHALVSFVGFPAPFQQDILISDSDSFSAFVAPTGILFSNGLVSIGLEFQLPDGVHFGYATVFRPALVQYGYNETPGAPIATLAAAPEPATWVMMIVGLVTMGAFARRGNKSAWASAQVS